MAGLLGDSWEDPRTQATLSMAAGLLSGGNFGQAFGRGLQGYQQSMSASEDAKLRKMQMDETKRKLEEQQGLRDWRAGLTGVLQQKVSVPSDAGPTAAPDTAAINQYLLDPRSPFADKLIERRLFPKEEEPYTLGEGQVRYKGGQVVARGPAKTVEQPSAVREYEYALGQGYKGTFEQFQTAQKRAGASSTTVKVNTERSFLNELAGGLGKQIEASVSQANSAKDTLATLNNLDSALNSKKIMAGPATNPAMYLMQVGTQMGLGGKDSEETLQNTRSAIQAMAQLELDAAGQMRGSGSITEAERALLKRAAAGDITMSMPELKRLSAIARGVATRRINLHNEKVQPLLQNPNAAMLSPFLRVDAGAESGGVVDFGGLK